MTFFHGVLFFIAIFVQVFLMGFQSRNVNSGQYFLAASTSIIISASQIFYIRVIAVSDPWIAFLICSIAGPMGITAAMASHHQMFKKPES